MNERKMGMKVLLAALNAKYIHSSLALRSLKAYADLNGEYTVIKEYTINNLIEQTVSDIYKEKPDIIGFSCYIWNIEMIKVIAARLKKVLTNAVMVFGGPEVSYDAVEFLEHCPFGDLVMKGEGERTYKNLLGMWSDGSEYYSKIDGIVYRKNGEIFENPNAKPLNLDDIPFVYDDVSDLKNKIIYYETQRGCPYNCQYCLSSIEKGVRFLSPERVKHDLQFFLDKRVRQVKFVDRTFNCSHEHAMMVWKYLMEHDNGITNFHMEITADILKDEAIEMLKSAREGLFQFEIGVQSTNERTIDAVKRNTAFGGISGVVKKISESGNIHQHLDLIVGLPYENYESFANSFNAVYALEPEQFQLGFLKLLRGSGLRKDAEKYGIVYADEAPYEVLYTDELSFDEILRLKDIEEMVETFLNSGKALTAVKYAVKTAGNPFGFFEALSDWWSENGYFDVSHSKMELYDRIFEFLKQYKPVKEKLDMLKELLRYDIFCGDNIKTIPEALERETSEEEKQFERDFYMSEDNIEKYIPKLKGYTPKQLLRMCRIEFFDMDIETQDKGVSAVLFDYYDRDIISNKAKAFVLS
ncbi:MAG: B12-binding domain-containing radical SAM protein [Candidatus Metalachnospira sp.]|nr:B12-binding domain-containing radical SAM protein [Candidatus Metalachnospira sp.]